MRLRYQLRGLGIGIVVTALLMGVAMEDGIPLTDAEIKAKAFALGMVESDSLKLTDVGNATPPPGSSAASVPGVSGQGEDPVSGSSASGAGEGTGADSASGAGEGTGADSASGAGEGTGPDSAFGAGGDPGTDLPEGGGTPASTPEGGSAAQDPGGMPSGEGEPGRTGTPVSGQRPDDDMVTVVIEAGTISYVISQMLEEAGLVEDAAEFDTYLCNNGYSRKVQEGTYIIQMGTSEEEIAKIITKGR